MIRITDKNRVTSVYFPKNSDVIPETLELTVSRGGAVVSVPISDITYRMDYINVMADFSTLDNGEYEYRLTSGETGLIRIGEIENNFEKYEDKEVYEFYEG